MSEWCDVLRKARSVLERARDQRGYGDYAQFDETLAAFKDAVDDHVKVTGCDKMH